MAINPSSDNNINALLLGESWTGNTGQAVEVTYTVASDYDSGTGAFSYNILEVPDYFQDAVENILLAYARVSGLSFDYVTPSQSNDAFNSAIDLTIVMADLGSDTENSGTLGFSTSVTTGDRTTSADVVVTDNFTVQDMQPGGQGYLTLLHEVGHALGLAHGDDLLGDDDSAPSGFGAVLDSNLENLDASVLISLLPVEGEYATVNSLPEGPQVYDIAALQYLYGSSTENSGNTSYGFDGSRDVSLTYWDAAGFDEVRTTSYGGNARVDISETTNASVVGASTFWFAKGSNVENVYSGSGSDFIVGNNIGNLVESGAGNDTINGFGGGFDNLNAGDGVDTLQMIAGYTSDVILWQTVDQANDANLWARNFESVDASLTTQAVYINGDAANNTIEGGLGGDTLFGGKGDDIVRGAQASDFSVAQLDGYTQEVIEALGYSSEQAYTNAGAEGSLTFARDFLNGNVGNDNVFGGEGNDSVHGGKDNDTVNGGKGNDLVYGDLGNDLVRGGQGNDVLYGNDGNDTLNGDLGDLDQLYGGGGSDIFFFDTSNATEVIIWDFVSGTDFIQLSSQGNFISASQIFEGDAVDATAAGSGTPLDDVGYSSIDIGNGTTIIVAGAVMGADTNLDADDFIIV